MEVNFFAMIRTLVKRRTLPYLVDDPNKKAIYPLNNLFSIRPDYGILIAASMT